MRQCQACRCLLGRRTVALAGTLADAGEDGVTTVGLGDVVDELLDEHSLADTGTAKEANLAATGVGGEEVDDLDARLEHLGRGRLVDVLGRVGVDGQVLDGLDRATLVNGLANDVDDAAECARADGDHDGVARVDDLLATDETLGTCTPQRVSVKKREKNLSAAVACDLPSMAMVRTVFSPRCMATSSTRRPSGRSTSRALKMAGSLSPSKATSTTAASQAQLSCAMLIDPDGCVETHHQ